MDIAALLFLAAFFVPPLAVVAGAAVVLWPRTQGAKSLAAVEKTAVQH
jgi:hypothetical protein